MKKTIYSILAGSLLFSFSYAKENSIDPITKGKRLARHCAWCHDVKRNIIAPSFMVILERYKDVPDEELRKIFFKSIKEGSKGKWNKWIEENIQTKMGKPEDMYMPAQKPYFNDKEINLIVDWLLSLRKKK